MTEKLSAQQIRVKAAELAAQSLDVEVQVQDLPTGPRLLSLCIFFEMYISRGADYTEKTMQILSEEPTREFRVIAGGALKK